MSPKRQIGMSVPSIIAATKFSTNSAPVTSCTIGVAAKTAVNRCAAEGDVQRRSVRYSSVQTATNIANTSRRDANSPPSW